MTTYENRGVLSYKDEQGNIQKMFPVTDLDLVRGIETVINHMDNKSNPHETKLTDLGITVDADKINFLSKVKSDIQDQIDQLSVKVDSSTGDSSADTAAILKAISDGDAAVTKSLENKLSVHTNEASTLIDAKANKEKTATVKLSLSAWTATGDFFSQDVTVNGVTADNNVITAPSTAHMNDYMTYASCNVVCAEQSAGSLKFLCWTKPDRDLYASVVILNA